MKFQIIESNSSNFQKYRIRIIEIVKHLIKHAFLELRPPSWTSVFGIQCFFLPFKFCSSSCVITVPYLKPSSAPTSLMCSSSIIHTQIVVLVSCTVSCKFPFKCWNSFHDTFYPWFISKLQSSYDILHLKRYYYSFL